MKKSVIIIVLIILISNISFAQELKPGDLYINDILIPYEISDFDEAFSDLGESFEEEEPKQISYVYANGQRIAKVENNEVFYFHNDHLGSPRMITDSNGKVIERIDYLPFGESFDGNEKISYNSKELDKDTNLNYYGARYYNALVGRFITADTVKGHISDPQSLNIYVYTRNNPLKYIDPSGNQEENNEKKYGSNPIHPAIITSPDAETRGVCRDKACALVKMLKEGGFEAYEYSGVIKKSKKGEFTYKGHEKGGKLEGLLISTKQIDWYYMMGGPYEKSFLLKFFGPPVASVFMSKHITKSESYSGIPTKEQLENWENILSQVSAIKVASDEKKLEEIYNLFQRLVPVKNYDYSRASSAREENIEEYLESKRIIGGHAIVQIKLNNKKIYLDPTNDPEMVMYRLSVK